MGPPASVHVDVDGESIWAFIRCDETSPVPVARGGRFGIDCMNADGTLKPHDTIYKFDSKGNVVKGGAGGLLMGVGAVLAFGCNIGGFFSATSALSLSGLGMMLGIELFPAALLTGVVTFALLGLQRIGLRTFEAVIAAFVATIGACYLAEIWYSHPPLGQVALHAVKPEFAGLHDERFLIDVILGGASADHADHVFAVGLEHGNSTIGQTMMNVVFFYIPPLYAAVEAVRNIGRERR